MSDPTNPFSSPLEPSSYSNSPVPPEYQEAVRLEAERLVKEKHSRSTAIQLFVTGLIGCFAPILAIYGIIFLIRRPEPFPLKGLAIAGTILHCLWSVLIIGLWTSAFLTRAHQ